MANDKTFVMTKDQSADLSFTVSGQGLSDNTIYYVERCVSDSIKGIYAKDVMRLAISLQGLINRCYGNTHHSLIYFDVTQSDDFWFDYITSQGKTFHQMNVVRIDTLEGFLDLVLPLIKECGLIEWDGNVPATSNVALTICGLDGYLPIRKDEDPDSFYSLLLAKGVEVKQSLVGMFGEGGSAYGDDFVTCQSAKNDAYRWAYKHYFHRCSSRYIAYILDGAACVPGSRFESIAHTPGLNCIFNYDYYLTRGCFFFDLTCIDIERPCDDPDQPLGTDLETLKMILQGRYDRANGAFGQILGFPPWWVKYTVSRGMGSVKGPAVEWIYVSLITAYNLAKEADAAHPCTMSNASVYCQYQSVFESYKNPRPKTKKVFNKKTKYFTFYGGDYDSAAWLKQWVAEFWKDQARTTLPIHWAFNPNLSERAPMVFDYIHEYVSDNDFFTAGDTGAGYVIPAALYENCSLRHLPDGSEDWAAYCKYYYNKFDLDITGFIINGHYPLTREIMKTFAEISPVGNFHNCGNSTMAQYNGVPFVYLHNGVSGKPQSVERCAKAMHSHIFNRMKDYNFSAYRYVCDSPSDTKRLVEAFLAYAKEQNPEYDYEYVDVYTFFDLLEQSGQCTAEL